MRFHWRAVVFGALACISSAGILLLQCGEGAVVGPDASDRAVAERLDEEGPGDSDVPDGDAGCIHPSVVEECRDGWCRIPKGCFWMGSPESEFGKLGESENLRAITLTHDFIIQQHELTQGEWTALGWPNRSRWFDAGVDSGQSFGDCIDPSCPASEITWWEAASYANDLSRRNGLTPCYSLTACDGGTSQTQWLVCAEAKPTAATPYDCSGYRLPTDAEWEYAARAGTRTAFYSGDITPYPLEAECNVDKNLEPIGWYCWNSGSTTHPVGLKGKNGWGLFDVAGNAWELTNEPFAYARTAVDPWSPIPPPSAPQLANITQRSGAVNAWASLSRSASRIFASGGAHSPAMGVRLARTLPGGTVQWVAPSFDGGLDAGGQ